MEATRCLREEHQVILKVLGCFEAALGEWREAGALDRAAFERFIEFFRGFADHCHHCKEEDRLFPVLVSAGMPAASGPIGCMLSEHAQARDFVRRMAERVEADAQGDRDGRRVALELGEAYLDLLRQHIAKEDHVLFNMADGMLDDSAVQGLTTAYGEAESKPEYCERFTRCQALADELVARYG